MILDHSAMASDAQAYSADAGSTNVLDLSVGGRRLGAGEPMAFSLHVDVAADATTGDETYEFEIQTDDNESFASATDLGAVTIARGLLTLGSQHTLFIDPSWVFERFARVRFDGGGTTPTITATIHLAPLCTLEKVAVYPNGYLITR